MRLSGSPTAVPTYTIPPLAPPIVAQAKDAFDSVSGKWEATRAELRAAKAALQDAKDADLQAAADAFAKGDEPTDQNKHQREANERVAELQERAKALDIALDDTGNALAHAIAKAKGDWVPGLKKAHAEAVAKYDKALTQALAALENLGPVDGAIAWLESFDAGLAEGARQAPYHGGKLAIRGTMPGQLRGTHDPEDLLRLAALLTKPEEPKPPNRLQQSEMRSSRAELVGAAEGRGHA